MKPDKPTLLAALVICLRLMRLDKPIGILLLLWPTLWALWLSSDGRPDGGVAANDTFSRRAA